VVIDHVTKVSKGFGFVYFGDDNERTRSLTEMQGYQLSYRPIKVNVASKKGAAAAPPMTGPTYTPQPAYNQPPASYPYNTPSNTNSASDMHNTTVFVGGIDHTITSDILRR
jgi:RNA recognition motif-containing protein